MILEAKYGVMQAFYNSRQKVIAKSLEQSVKGAIESLIMGKAVDPFAGVSQKIESDFKDFISSRAVERMGLSGVPTAAAKAGVNHRLAHPFRKGNPRRPSFIDSGLLFSLVQSVVDPEELIGP
jgi:hypothetical protein